MLKKISVAMLALSFLCGCATKLPPDLDTHYKTTQSPPHGFARVYVFPGKIHSIFGETSAFYAVHAGPSDNNQAVVGSASGNNFVGFDARPGNISIRCEGAGSVSEAGMFTLADGQTLRLQPVQETSSTVLFGVLGAIAKAAMTPDGNFRTIESAEASTLMSTRTLAPISSEARAFFVQASSSPIAPPAVPLSSAAPSALPSAKNSAQTGGNIEAQLKELRSLNSKGLITQSEYDAKRKQLLDKIN